VYVPYVGRDVHFAELDERDGAEQAVQRKVFGEEDLLNVAESVSG